MRTIDRVGPGGIDPRPVEPPPPTEPTARSRRWPDAGIGVLVAGFLAFIAARPLADNSFLTHLATGRLMLSDGIPATNPFLYSSTDFPVPSWFWSSILGVVDLAGGGTGIRILTAAMAGALGLLVVRLTRPDGDPVDGTAPDRTLLSIVLPAVCVVITLMPFVNARPQLPGYMLLALTVLVVKERRAAWWLVPVFGLWVNVHGTWFYGLAVLGLVLVAQAIDDRRVELREVLCVAWALAGVVLGGLAQPEPFQTVLLPLSQFGDERSREALSSYVEWQPAGFDHPLTWLLIAVGLVAVYGALVARPGGARRWGVLVGSVGLVAMGLSAGRLLPLAAITLVPWVASGIGGLEGLGMPSRRIQQAFVAIGSTMAFVALLWIVATPAYDLSRYPVTAVDWLEEHGLAGQSDVKVVSHDYVGNYLDWRYEDRANTFVDDRAGADALIDYSALLDLSDGWQGALERSDADVVLWSTEEPLTDELDAPDWYDAGEFGDFTVFCRSSIADRCR
ncbi:hypothetical protein [Dermatobacter hominis]|uniref:hypothetical protein n=1 Tax=Dermatobacter hominis TaxID=2884263 RepID=UPI001D12A281|nr:hypothetical protein [Dermatobacter hominis]UDY36073.1 hypothetical protein LH044_00705 [Dermatobacter hominis]